MTHWGGSSVVIVVTVRGGEGKSSMFAGVGRTQASWTMRICVCAKQMKVCLGEWTRWCQLLRSMFHWRRC